MRSLFPRLRRGRARRAAASCARSGAPRPRAGGDGAVPIAARRHGRARRRRSSARLPPESIRLRRAVDAHRARRHGVARDGADGASTRARVILAAPAYAAAALLAPIDARRRGAVRAGALRLDRERRAGLAARARSRIRSPAPASSSRGGTATCGSPRARGCRRSGTGRAPDGRCCCARSSAARTIPARSI